MIKKKRNIQIIINFFEMKKFEKRKIRENTCFTIISVASRPFDAQKLMEPVDPPFIRTRILLRRYRSDSDNTFKKQLIKLN